MTWKKWVFGGIATILGVAICVLLFGDNANEESFSGTRYSSLWGLILGSIVYYYFKRKE